MAKRFFLLLLSLIILVPFTVSSAELEEDELYIEDWIIGQTVPEQSRLPVPVISPLAGTTTIKKEKNSMTN